jgi:hypothetical protein
MIEFVFSSYLARLNGLVGPAALLIYFLTRCPFLFLYAVLVTIVLILDIVDTLSR